MCCVRLSVYNHCTQLQSGASLHMMTSCHHTVPQCSWYIDSGNAKHLRKPGEGSKDFENRIITFGSHILWKRRY